MAPPRTLVDTRALHPGAIVEVLDAAKLWFPAEVLSVGPAGVRVHFLGWGKAWDDSVSVREYAARLCQYRGWGRTLPGDFRVGEHVEALDLTGVWLPCRVLAVAEALVKVHYLGWPSKWDEWIHRTAGRLQRVKPGTDVRGATEAGKALVARACKAVTRSRVPEVACRHDLDLNEEICSVCEGVGELVCCEGRCLRSFHAECVKPLLAEVGAPPLAPELVVRTRCPRFGAAAPPPPLEPIVERETGAPAEGESRPPSMREGGSSSETADEATPRAGAQRLTRRVEATRRTLDAAGEAGAWVCPDCAHGAQRCALCGEVEREGEALQPPIRCTKPRCCKAFHPSCLASAWEQYGPACAAADRACARGVCPAHVCWECGEPENGRYGNAMTVCCGCGSGFHRSCIPPGSSAFVSSTLGHGLCAECERARGAGGGRARSGARTSGTCAPGARMRPMRGLVPFRFASIPLKDDASGADGDDVDRVAGGGGGWPRGYEVHNVRLLREMRRTSEVGFPWEPLRRRRAPVPFELPAKITAELVEGACDASRGFRPPSFSLICRSIWRAARMDGAKRGEGEPCACSASGLSCGEGCLNRHTLHECTAATCAVGEVACNNRRIQRGVYPALSVFKTLNKASGRPRGAPARRAMHASFRRHPPTRAPSTSRAHRATAAFRRPPPPPTATPFGAHRDAPARPPTLSRAPARHAPRAAQGWGVRADCPISHGDIVIEYVGEVIDRDEWERRNATATQHEAIYSMHLSHNLIIDAAHKGNVSRFINHSCAPNLQVCVCVHARARAEPGQPPCTAPVPARAPRPLGVACHPMRCRPRSRTHRPAPTRAHAAPPPPRSRAPRLCRCKSGSSTRSRASPCSRCATFASTKSCRTTTTSIGRANGRAASAATAARPTALARCPPSRRPRTGKRAASPRPSAGANSPASQHSCSPSSSASRARRAARRATTTARFCVTRATRRTTSSASRRASRPCRAASGTARRARARRGQLKPPRRRQARAWRRRAARL